MTAAITAIWFLGAYMAHHYMASTNGPTFDDSRHWAHALSLVIILIVWPVWVAVWIIMDLARLVWRGQQS